MDKRARNKVIKSMLFNQVTCILAYGTLVCPFILEWVISYADKPLPTGSEEYVMKAVLWAIIMFLSIVLWKVIINIPNFFGDQIEKIKDSVKDNYKEQIGKIKREEKGLNDMIRRTEKMKYDAFYKECIDHGIGIDVDYELDSYKTKRYQERLAEAKLAKAQDPNWKPEDTSEKNKKQSDQFDDISHSF